MAYGVIHMDIFDSSISLNHRARWVFQDMIVLADCDDNVMMNDVRLALRIRAPIEEVRSAISFLASPDGDSRSSLDDGRRITEIKNEMGGVIGYHIVNRHHYKRLLGYTRRKEYMRRYRAEKRDNEWKRRVSELGGKP